jgi:hypothetical protein
MYTTKLQGIAAKEGRRDRKRDKKGKERKGK